jgi:hypothetical protein
MTPTKPRTRTYNRGQGAVFGHSRPTVDDIRGSKSAGAAQRASRRRNRGLLKSDLPRIQRFVATRERPGAGWKTADKAGPREVTDAETQGRICCAERDFSGGRCGDLQLFTRGRSYWMLGSTRQGNRDAEAASCG